MYNVLVIETSAPLEVTTTLSRLYRACVQARWCGLCNLQLDLSDPCRYMYAILCWSPHVYCQY